MNENALNKEVIQALTQNPNDIPFEVIPDESTSPLNHKVKEKNLLDQKEQGKDWNIWKPKAQTATEEHPTHAAQGTFEPPQSIPYETHDAPEQDFGSNVDHSSNDAGEKQTEQPIDDQATFELPTATARQAADTILGMSNNVLAVGGGLFVKIKKHKEFYEFDQVVELIDGQNEKNVRRIQLDKDDKALLKPLLVAILKKKAKKLTPEQQLIGAVLSIVMKKAQIVMEIRAENELLVDRILEIVKQEHEVKETTHSSVTNAKAEEPEIPIANVAQMQQEPAFANNQAYEQSNQNATSEELEDLYTEVVEVDESQSKFPAHE